ncbi:divalent cation tolerance protein from Thermus Thermophilus Hb8 [Chytriomyces sp. MP71]|nr:divalent cation tolerance protein from Thermus Thermophilus Hb8 [Chytriomyces sp. MP71]
MFQIVYITTPSIQVARELASSLVEKRLVACVNILPGVMSVYRWEGKVNTDEEVLLMCKTAKEKFAGVRDHVVGVHPYKVPEIVAVDVADALPAYAQWVTDETAITAEYLSQRESEVKRI